MEWGSKAENGVVAVVINWLVEKFSDQIMNVNVLIGNAV